MTVQNWRLEPKSVEKILLLVLIAYGFLLFCVEALIERIIFAITLERFFFVWIQSPVFLYSVTMYLVV